MTWFEWKMQVFDVFNSASAFVALCLAVLLLWHIMKCNNNVFGRNIKEPETNKQTKI